MNDTSIRNTWENRDGEWCVRCPGGLQGDLVNVVSRNGKITKVKLGCMVDIGVFMVDGKKATKKPTTKKPITQTTKSGFECFTCSRCSGTGHFSYCPMYGTRCFKCNGSGTLLTTRGHNAYMVYQNSLKIPVPDVKIGMLLRDENPVTGVIKWHKIESIDINDKKYTFNCAEWIVNTDSDSEIRIGWSAEDKAIKIKAALEYQATL